MQCESALILKHILLANSKPHIRVKDTWVFVMGWVQLVATDTPDFVQSILDDCSKIGNLQDIKLAKIKKVEDGTQLTTEGAGAPFIMGESETLG